MQVGSHLSKKNHVIKKTQKLYFLVASLEYGLDENTEKSKYVFTPREHK